VLVIVYTATVLRGSQSHRAQRATAPRASA
jgi:hypothetical protein